MSTKSKFKKALLGPSDQQVSSLGRSPSRPSHQSGLRRSLRLETLEKRELMAVTATLENGLLSILGNDSPNIVVVRPNPGSPGGYSVDGVNIRVVNTRAVSRIDVSTMKGDDTIDVSLANVPSKIHAGQGNDVVTGTMYNDEIFTGFGNDRVFARTGDDMVDLGPGDDVVFAGKGRDRLLGGDGNDQLFGDLDSDFLDGGAGNDMLFGGTGDGRDTLLGGAGRDVFLVPSGEDSVSDLKSEDARVNFASSPAVTVRSSGLPGSFTFQAGAWDNSQITRVAEPIRNLQLQTGTTRLLKTASRDEMTFLSVGAQTSGSAQIGGWNTGSTVAIVSLSLMSTSNVQRVVYHEIGHNWDDLSENRHVSQFRSVSGWIESDNTPPGYTASTGVGDRWQFLTSAAGTFARSYGMLNPKEDYATTWESYFMNAFHGGSSTLRREGLVANGAKFASLDRLFADLSRDA